MKTLFLIILSGLNFLTLQAQNQIWTPILNDYLTLEDALVASNTSEAKKALAKFEQDLQQIDLKSVKNEHQKNLKQLATQVEKSQKAASLEEFRSGFEKISASMIELAELKAFDIEALYIVYCPMKKASWLDDTKTVKNPYYGKSMLTCGSIKKTIELKK